MMGKAVRGQTKELDGVLQEAAEIVIARCEKAAQGVKHVEKNGVCFGRGSVGAIHANCD